MENILDVIPVPLDNTPSEAPSEEASAPQPKTEEPDPRETWKKRFDRLTSKERQILEAKKQIQQERSRYSKYDGLDELLQNDPLAALEKLGLDYHKLTERVLTSGDDDKTSKIEQRIAQLEAELKAERETKTKQTAEMQITQAKNSIKSLIESNKDDYEVLSATGDVDAVWELIVNYHAETGNVLDFKQACDAVEESLAEEYTQHIERLKQTKKLSSLFGAQSQEKSTTPPQSVANRLIGNEPKPPMQHKTLSNNSMQASSTSASMPISDADRMKAALEAIRNAKKR